MQNKNENIIIELIKFSRDDKSKSNNNSKYEVCTLFWNYKNQVSYLLYTPHIQEYNVPQRS